MKGKNGFTLIETIMAIVIIAVVTSMMASYFGVGITQSASPISRLQASVNLKRVMEMVTAQYSIPYWQANTSYATSASVYPATGTGCFYVATGQGTSGNSSPTWGACPPSATISDGGVTWSFGGYVLPLWQSNHAYAVGSVVWPGSGYTFGYIVTSGSGNSGGSQPTWPSTSGGSVHDGAVTWTWNGPPSSLMQIQASIGAEGSNQTASFGTVSYTYHVYQNRFVKFDASNNEVNINATPDDIYYGRFLKVQIGLSSSAQTLSTLFVYR